MTAPTMRRLPGILLVVALVAASLLPSLGWAQSFVVRDIRLEGLQRISAGTVFNYLPIKVGDQVDAARTAEAIRALFSTGFFEDVRVEQDGETLVVFVEERPSIATIEFHGNESVDTDDLRQALRDVGFAEGRAFNRSVFDSVEQELRRNYFSQGKYAVKITSTVTPLERNRVAVRFDVSEGEAARIKSINVVGNTVFDDDELLDGFNLTTTKWYLFFSTRDRYSRQALAADLEKLRSYYLDRGYINFSIDSTQVSVTPDKKDVYITVNVSEGDLFTVRDIKLAGELIVPEQDLFELISVIQGGVFSRKDVTDTASKLTSRLGEEGYAFANVNAIPDIDTDALQIDLTFFVDPGKRVYVRRINFAGNTKTRDEVLRREMRQLEGGWISTKAVERSKERLQVLGYFEEVNVETPAVPGTTDQVDVNFAVVERPSGSLIAGLGFSQTQGIVFSTSVTQENFLGTGNQFGVTFNNSDINRAFGVSWLNPYWTLDGISRGFNIDYRERDAEEANIADYSTDELTAGVRLGVPVSEFDRVIVGAEAERIDFNVGSLPSKEIVAFRDLNGDRFTNFLFSTSYTRDSRNSRLLPDRGTLNRVTGTVTVPGSDLTYYKAQYEHQSFFPLGRKFTLAFQGEVGYGDGYGGTGALPLISNFFAGGIRSVRGFEDNTLGPRDSRGQPLGGAFKLVGNLELILPVPFAVNVKSFRITSFIDAGNVYGPDEDIVLGDLRVSAGVGAIWLSPFGAMTVSGALPIKKEDRDDTQPLQFTFGTSF